MKECVYNTQVSLAGGVRVINPLTATPPAAVVHPY